MNSELREHAIHRIRARQQFYVHLVFFLAMGAYLVAVWARSDAPYFWPIWALLGWGIGLVAHASHVFGWQKPISEERIQREINRSI
ncbi:MAG: 2TM domain-containing protein [Acidimicrobiia bacterium]